jgi:hypothetical protein
LWFFRLWTWANSFIYCSWISNKKTYSRHTGYIFEWIIDLGPILSFFQWGDLGLTNKTWRWDFPGPLFIIDPRREYVLQTACYLFASALLADRVADDWPLLAGLDFPTSISVRIPISMPSPPFLRFFDRVSQLTYNFPPAPLTN